MDVAAIEERYASRAATLGVIGMGYVGLPLMLAATGSGLRVIGFDIDPPKVERLNAGFSPLAHIGHAPIAAARETGRFEATADFRRISDTDAILICVPTPLGQHKEPDLSYVVGTIEAITSHLRSGQLIVLESTTWPGTTDEVVKPLVEAAGFQSGSDIFIAYSPEREDPGNSEFKTGTIPKVVGGDGETALRLACTLYRQFVSHVVPVSTPATAEAVKLTENIFRAVNIALVNELKLVLDRMDIDIFEVIDAAKTKPFGYMPFYPGPGLGGHCIPIDPFYLTWRAREFGIATKFIELAGEINTAMPQHVLEKAAEALDRQQGKGLSSASVLLLGVAYKKNVDDMRESPALVIWELLRNRGATVAYHDPNVPVIPATREHASLAGSRSVPLDAVALEVADLVLIVTDHGSVDYRFVAESARLVIDTRNVMAPFADEMGSRLVRA